MEPILKRAGSDIVGAKAAAADLGISCERCSQALTWSDREGPGSLPLSQARVDQNWWVKESHWRISVASTVNILVSAERRFWHRQGITLHHGS